MMRASSVSQICAHGKWTEHIDYILNGSDFTSSPSQSVLAIATGYSLWLSCWAACIEIVFVGWLHNNQRIKAIT